MRETVNKEDEVKAKVVAVGGCGAGRTMLINTVQIFKRGTRARETSPFVGQNTKCEAEMQTSKISGNRKDKMNQ